MTTSDELYNAAMDLSIEERLALANRLFESAYDEKEPGYDGAWDEEVKRRLDEIDSGAVTMIPGDQVRREMFERLRAPRS